MFTGLVRELGLIREAPVPSGKGGVRLAIEHSPELGRRLSLGASLAVSGVCLTVIEGDETRSVVELSPETLAKTTLGELGGGDRVNLEPPLSLGEPLGGHFVLGHVDATLEVLVRRDLGEHAELTVSLPPSWRTAVVPKGSVTLDGVSLTVAALEADRFTVALIPHTLAVTTLGALEPGRQVNFEADVLGKYVLRAVESFRPGGGGA